MTKDHLIQMRDRLVECRRELWYERVMGSAKGGALAAAIIVESLSWLFGWDMQGHQMIVLLAILYFGVAGLATGTLQDQRSYPDAVWAGIFWPLFLLYRLLRFVLR